MSLSYGPLAFWYDQLTLDVPYEDFIDFSKDMIEPYFPMVVEFINKVKEYLLLPPTTAN